MIVSFPAETVIMREGEANTDMYKILSGNVVFYSGYGTDSVDAVSFDKKG